MGTKVIAQVKQMVEGDTSVMVVTDVNIIDNSLQSAMSGLGQKLDYEYTFTVDRAVGGNIYTPAMLYAQIIDFVSVDVTTKSGTYISRYEIFVPGWNAYRDSITISPYFFDDFIATSTVSGQVGELGWVLTSSGSGAFASGSSTYNQPGAMLLTTGTTANSNPRMSLPDIPYSSIGEMTFIATMPADISSFGFEMGLYITTHRINLYYNSSLAVNPTHLYLRRLTSGFATIVDSSLVNSANTRVKVTLMPITTSTTRFYFELSTGGKSSQVVTHDAIPLTHLLRPFLSVDNKTTSARQVSIDWFSMRLNVTRR